MNYTELNNLYKNNEFRQIDKDEKSEKFYLLRSISKSATLKKFCEKFSLEKNLDNNLQNEQITIDKIKNYIRESFVAKTDTEIRQMGST